MGFDHDLSHRMQEEDEQRRSTASQAKARLLPAVSERRRLQHRE
ncbi:hypothetical protein [Streptomyces sp. NPDC000994]